MQYTPRGYKKPEGTDRVLRQDLVDMMEAIDTDNTAQDTALTAHKTAATMDHPANSVTDGHIGTRVIDDTINAVSGAGILTNLLGKIGNMIKKITGKSNWYSAPATTLETANTHIVASSGAHAASAISSTATGDVSATNVQAAIAELAAEKLAKDYVPASGIRVLRDVAQYKSLSNPTTGAIKIVFPTPSSALQIRMTIKGFNHLSVPWQAEFTLGLSASSWGTTVVLLSPNCPFSTVRFGTDGTNFCAILGTTSTTWVYPAINVDEVILSDASFNTVTNNFSVSMIASETGFTLQATPTIKTLATVEGTAPSGYGLGTYAKTTGSADLNTLIVNGYYLTTAGAPNTPPWATTAQGGHLEVYGSNSAGTYVAQRATGIYTGEVWERILNNGTWTAWKQIPTMDLVAPAGYGLGEAATTATGDWNNYKTTGFFMGTSLANGPTTGAGHWYWVTVIKNGNTYVYQQAHGFSNAGVATWERTLNNGTWTAWKQVAITDSPTFTGIPKAPTAAPGTNTDQIATMAALQAAISAISTGRIVSYQLGLRGYIAFDMGLIIQWGTGESAVDVAFPIEFPTNCYGVLIGPPANLSWTPWANNITKTGFRVQVEGGWLNIARSGIWVALGD